MGKNLAVKDISRMQSLSCLGTQRGMSLNSDSAAGDAGVGDGRTLIPRLRSSDHVRGTGP